MNPQQTTMIGYWLLSDDYASTAHQNPSTPHITALFTIHGRWKLQSQVKRKQKKNWS